MYFKFQFSNFKLSRGVTLVELVVVLAILSVVVGTAAGIFSSLLQRTEGISVENDMLFQTNALFEHLSPLIQEAKPDDTGNCLGAGYEGYHYVLSHLNAESEFYEGIKFLAKDNVCQEFFLDNDGFFKEVKDAEDPQPLLSLHFHVAHAQFVINGNRALKGVSGSDAFQPLITLVVSVESKNKSKSAKIVQTTFSQRRLNIP